MSFVVVTAAALIGCGDDAGGVDQCANVVPPPAACNTQCDPTPGAPTTCPGGFHCTPDGTCNAYCTQGGTECGDGYRCTPDGRCVGEDECVGLECNIVDCDGMGMPLTTISGTVYAPNGTLPLFGINVYVPNQAVADPPEGAICDRCTDSSCGGATCRSPPSDCAIGCWANPVAGAACVCGCGGACVATFEPLIQSPWLSPTGAPVLAW